MKLGKVSEAVQKRCISNIIRYKGKYPSIKSKKADTTSAVESHGGDVVVTTMTTINGNQDDIGIYAVTRAVNDLLCRYADPMGVHVMVHLPESAKESKLKAIVQSIENFCSSVEVPVLNVQAITTSTVNSVQVTVTALGESNKSKLEAIEQGGPDQDIVMIGEVGLEGALRLLSEKREVFESRFAPSFLRTLDNRYDDMAKSVREIRALNTLGQGVIHQVPESGVLGGLWELAEATRSGVEVQLREIPIAQEVIEVCEYMGVNPYRLGAAGTVVVVTKDGDELVNQMSKLGHDAVVIGKTTDGNEKILCNGDDVRHLERPAQNELYKVLEERQEEAC